MATSVVMPALEMAQETGKLVSWLKKEGDAVRKGDMLLEVETDKAVVEVEAQANGVLGGITAKVGDVVPVGQTIAWLLKPGESVPKGTAQAQTGRKMDSSPVAAAAAAAPAAVATSVAGARISPKARRLAREHGIDISALRGSGPNGEILADDILKAASAPPTVQGPPKGGPHVQQGASPYAQQVVAPTDVGSGFSRPTQARQLDIPQPTGPADAISTIGRIMAERTTHSWTTVPHFFVSRDIDATELNAVRNKLVPLIEQSHGVKLTHTDLMVAAVARALHTHRRMNASWVNNGITLNTQINVALAMAVENAVVTAVIHDADRSSLGQIAKRRKELAERARANKLQPADIAGATFTISNLGMFDVDHFTAIIVPPQAGILAVGAIKERVVAINGMLGVRPTMTVTLSSDHRVIDGARAAAFLNDVVINLAEPQKWI